MTKRALYFRNGKTGEIVRPFLVTGKSERQIERIESGMLINIGEDWFACDTEYAELDEAEHVFAMLATRTPIEGDS